MQFTSMISEGVNSYMSLFADDAKLLKKVGSEEDSQPLQQDLDMIKECSSRWETEFNTKCSVMEFEKIKKRASGN